MEKRFKVKNLSLSDGTTKKGYMVQLQVFDKKDEKFIWNSAWLSPAQAKEVGEKLIELSKSNGA